MIISIKHKGLDEFYRSDSTKGIQGQHEKKLRRILSALDGAEAPSDMDLPGYELHALKGKRSGTWSVSVSGNWRVTWQFSGKSVELVDYEDYH